MKLALASLAILIAALAASAQQVQSNFTALDMDGNPVDIATLRGKVVVINLWFINCPNCLEEISQLNELVNDYKGKSDVVFLGLAASPKPALDKFLAKTPFN